MKKKLLIILGSITIILCINLFLVSRIDIKLPKGAFLIEHKNQNIKLLSLKSQTYLDNYINNYLDDLKSCYNETKFFDKNNNVTINKYQIEKKKIFNSININYTEGNLCLDEFVLEENWYHILNNASADEITLENCKNECETINIDKSKLNVIYDYFFSNKLNRLENKYRISATSDYILTIYFKSEQDYYNLQIFNYDNNIAFNRIDQNDASKNAIYHFDNLNLQDLINKIQ